MPIDTCTRPRMAAVRHLDAVDAHDPGWWRSVTSTHWKYREVPQKHQQ